jgi:flagellar protein FlaJ
MPGAIAALTRLWPGTRAPARSDAVEDAANWQHSTSLFKPAPTDFDLITQLTYMSALATANVGREQLFEKTAELGYSTSGYFHRVHLVAQRLNYDYARACQLVADDTDNEAVQSLLLRFSASLAAGESESAFLARETEVQLEHYSRKYQRDLETLQKWTDSYVALMVSVTLIVVVSLVSMMIYSSGALFIVGLAVVMIGIAALGGWIIYRTAPVEPKTHQRTERSRTQDQMYMLARILLPVSALLGAAVALVFSPGAGMIAAAVAIAPLGLMAFADDRRIDLYDKDLTTFLRALGSVVGAVQTTVTDGLERMDHRSLASLEHGVRRLQVRLRAGINPDLCWGRFVSETGSELVDRSVGIFWDTLKVGGEPDAIGYLSSQFAMKISLLRQNRRLVSQTFMFLMVPLHAVLLGVLLFVTEVIVVFANQLSAVQSAAYRTTDADLLAQVGPGQLAFASPNVAFIHGFALIVTIVLTVVDTWAPHAASGGHHHKVWLYGALMLLLSGVALMGIPPIVQGLFHGVAAGSPVTTTSTIPTG